jgi:hypothetical protein
MAFCGDWLQQLVAPFSFFKGFSNPYGGLYSFPNSLPISAFSRSSYTFILSPPIFLRQRLARFIEIYFHGVSGDKRSKIDNWTIEKTIQARSA